ncbi:hypothetical protein E2C01_003991 [Portunus trituberculatus]|uniref:Uncharacterized protein n=1 Tax=Portunus trituberculatus TaxID=210409 RepID=A0A5B7CQ65_PORTR|nr:hypothetical protein [Portunus trituberculatus]
MFKGHAFRNLETTPLFPTWPASVALLALRGYCQENTATDSSTLYIQMKIRLHYNSRNPKTVRLISRRRNP